MSNIKGMRTPHVSTWGGASGGSMDNYPELAEKVRHLCEKYGGQGQRLFDDFNEAALVTNKWLFTEGTDSATSAAAHVAAGDHYLRIITGDAGTGFAADGCMITGPALTFKASRGLLFRTRFKVDLVTVLRLQFGFTDSLSLEQTFSIGALDALTSVATDAVAAVYDTGAATDTYQLCGVKNDVDATKVITALLPVTTVWEEWEIYVSPLGTAEFYRNGVLLGTVANAVTVTAPLVPFIQAANLSGTTVHNIDVDYIEALELSR